eukprot:15461990-Alexandrium_andersonii.AAC.1
MMSHLSTLSAAVRVANLRALPCKGSAVPGGHSRLWRWPALSTPFGLRGVLDGHRWGHARASLRSTDARGS